MIQTTKSTINEASKDLLLKLLRSAGLTKVQSKIYLGKHGNSLDTYLYRNFKPNFPPSFSYFFLNAIASSRPLAKDSKSKSKKYAFVDDLKNAEKNSFHKILEKYKDLNINQKLILPCLEYHCNIHIKLSNSKFIHDEENYVKRYVDEVLPGLREEIEEFENYQFDETNPQPKSVSEAIKITNAKILINSIKDFYVHLEILRKKHMPNFIAPNETFLLPVLNSNEKILFSKDFVKRNLNLNKYNDLVLLNVRETNMQGTINLGDMALIVKFQSLKQLDEFYEENGIYAIKLNGKICIRRLQFLKLKQREVVHIISDNKLYRDDVVDLVELISMIFGKVVWRSNSFKDIDFLKHITEEPNLFLPKEDDFEIPLFLNKDKKEIA
jgi:hypothetical protein